MLRPEGSDPATIATRCATGSATRHRAAGTPRRWRSGRTASAGGCTRPRPRVFAGVGLCRRHGRGDRARGRHVEGDVLRALRQQGGLHRRAPRRGDDRGARGDAPRRRGPRRRRTPPAASAPVIHTFLDVLAAFPDEAQTLLVEIIGAGPRAMERRDRVLAEYASYVDEVNREDAARGGVAAARVPARRVRDRRRGDRARVAPDPDRASRTTSATSSRWSSGSSSGCCTPARARRRERSALAALDGRDPRVPPLPAARRLARAGGAREARGVPRRDLLGPADRRLRRSGGARAGPRARARRARRATAPGACSPATARATSCSPRCTAPGFANQPHSTHVGDGLALRDCWITAAVRCAPPANKPLPAERDACAHWLRAELALLPQPRVVVCLGAFAWEAGFEQLAPGATARGRASATARRRDTGALTMLAASTRASRTRSPAS